MGQIGARQLAALQFSLCAHAVYHVQIVATAVGAARAYALGDVRQIRM